MGGETVSGLVIAPGIAIVARSVMPRGFVPIAFRPPLWLRNGAGIAVLGSLNGRTMLVDFAGPGRQPSLVAADHSPDMPDGVLDDIAASPDRSSIAIAISRSKPPRLEILLYDAATAQKKPLASIQGEFEVVSLGWADASSVALAVRRAPSPPTAIPSDAREAGAAADTEPNLYLLSTQAAGLKDQITLACALSQMSWSPDGSLAVAQGDLAAQPMLVDRQRKSCTPLNVIGPIRVLGWSPKRGAFLYSGWTEHSPLPGTFQFNTSSGLATPIAVASSAAGYDQDGSVLAVGNRELSWQRAIERSHAITTAEVAAIDPAHGSTDVHTLGVQTLPEMLSSSVMAYSASSGIAAIELFAPGGSGALRHIIAYQAKVGREMLLASGPASGLTLMSWSPNGKLLALFHGGPKASELTLLSPGSAAPSMPMPFPGPLPSAVAPAGLR